MLPTPLRVLFVCRCTSGFCAASLTQTCWFVCWMCGWNDGWKNLWQGEYEDEKRRGRRWKCCFSHTSSLCLCVSVSLPVFFFLFPPDLPPTCLMSSPRVSGLCICTHEANWEKWTVRTHPSEHANTSQSLSVLFFSFFLESVRVHFCFSETANPEETVVPHTDGSIRIERMNEEEDEGSLLSLSATLTLLLDTVTLP